MRKPKIIIKKAGKKKGQCMVVVRSGNGEVLLSSEILNSQRAARENILAAAAALSDWFIGQVQTTNQLEN